MYIIDQINPPSLKSHKFILGVSNYFPKWVEVKALKDITQSEKIDFVKEQILQRFGILETITTDQGTVFIRRRFVKDDSLRRIKLITSAPYYTQANSKLLIRLLLV